MGPLTHLGCRECGRTYEAAPIYVCEWCFGPLEVEYDYDAIARTASRQRIVAGPANLWRYADLLPVKGDVSADLGAGFTPLVRAERLAAHLGLRELWIKNDSLNPTNSFKDRVVAVGLSKAIEFGYKTVACASTGNLAQSVAAHATRVGLESYVFIPAGLEPGKVIPTAIYGGHVVAVAGNYDEVNRLCIELAGAFPWAFLNINLRPYYAEGSKTLAFETVEQLGWRVPDHVVVPVASGSLLTKIKKGFDELAKVGLVPGEPRARVSGAQAAGCAPVVTAFRENPGVIQPVKPQTIARSIAIGNPADGYYAIDAVRESGGGFAAATDAEAVEATKLLARTEGIFAEPACGVTLAALGKLLQEGTIRPDETVVMYVTGHGLKTIDTTAGADPMTNLPKIKATVDEFRAAFNIDATE